MVRLGVACLCLVACGPNVGADEGADEGDGDGDASGSASSSGSTGTTTSVTTGATTPGTTTPMTTPTDSVSTGESGSTTTAGSTTGSIGPECVDASDCELFATCCDCEGIPVGGEGVDSCPGTDCESDMCTLSGVDEVECRNGRCAAVSVSCDPNGVICAVAPPDCEPPFVPGTSEGCWTGACVPAELCDWVPSCDYCPDDEVCVAYIPGPKGPTNHVCEPIPAACDGIATCECAGEPFCAAWGDCLDGDADQLSCVGA